MPDAPPIFNLRQQLQRHLGETFTLDSELRGGGGSAKVFLATEQALGRKVVLKVLPPDVSRGVDAERFRREILFVARLQHPHLVPLLNAGTVYLDNGGELRWFSMPFVEGQTLRDRLLRDDLTGRDRLRLLRELASALAYAHSRGIVHRDIKPENVLLSDGVSMIADFGVGKALDNAAAIGPDGKRVTSTSMLLGTPGYMAPEQIVSATVVDHRADLYAFGCLAYELFTGNPPLQRPSMRETLEAQVTERPEPIQQRCPSMPPTLAAVIMRCLEKDPAERLDSAATIVTTLDDLAHAAPISGAFAAVAPPSTAAPPARGVEGLPAGIPAIPSRPSGAAAPTPADTPVHSPARSGLTVLALAGLAVAVLLAVAWLARRG